MKKRILSGMRPTGPLHLGNYHGALANWVRLQEEYDCFFFVADWHALTSDYEKTDAISGYITDILLDWLSVGLDPEKSTLFIQSRVKEHAELFLILSMITPVPWLERNPTYKDQIEQLSSKDLSTFGFLGYPVLQAADIIMYKPYGVPVGVDQAPHVEITREIARRFNHFYGPVFPEPEVVLTQTPKLLGTDRRKMSKSYGNSIFLCDTADETQKKILPMVTDPARVRRTDAGDPDKCPVFTLHRVVTGAAERERLVEGCRGAGIGCIECKRVLIGHVNESLAPLRKRRGELAADPGLGERILAEGTARARDEAARVMDSVRKAVRL